MRVIALNAKGGQETGVPLAKMLKQLKPTLGSLVAIVSECDGAGDKVYKALTGIRGARVYRAGTANHGQREVAVVVMGSEVVHLFTEHHQLMPGKGWGGATQNREMVAELTRYRGRKIAFCSVHASTKPLSAGWQKGLAELAAVVADLKRRGYEIVIGGDFNENDTSAPDGLRAWAESAGLVANATRVMWGMTSPTLSVAKFEALPLPADISDHPTAVSLRLQVTRRKPKVKPYAPPPYGLTTRDGHTVDNITDYALKAAEKRLGYSLTVVQGSYNAGGVKASAGTHDGGGAVDLAPYDWERKVRAMRAVGFAAWHRTPIPGVWAEHVHCILIGNAKLSPSAAQQVTDYRNHRDGLIGEAVDDTWHPSPIPTFRMPKYAE